MTFSKDVLSGISRVSVLDPVLFNISVNYLDDGLENIIIRFIGHSKIRHSKHFIGEYQNLAGP